MRKTFPDLETKIDMLMKNKNEVDKKLTILDLESKIHFQTEFYNFVC